MKVIEHGLLKASVYILPVNLCVHIIMHHLGGQREFYPIVFHLAFENARLIGLVGLVSCVACFAR